MVKNFKQFVEDAVPVMGVANVGGPVSDNDPPGPSKLKKALLRRKRPLAEENKISDHIEKFKSYVAMELGLTDVPEVNVIDSREEAKVNTSFGGYSPTNRSINVNVGGRHIADVLRTLAHELVHHKQNEEGRLTRYAGETGSEFENEANSRAGVLMRNYGKKNPGIYEDYENT
jgi:Zn-dependent peptidase ImmA (M78 family)